MTQQSTDLMAAITLLIESAQGIVDALALLRKHVDAIDSSQPEAKTQPAPSIAQEIASPANNAYAERKALSDTCIRLWSFWKQVHGKQSAVRTKGRIMLVAKWVGLYGEERLAKAIQGCALSPHHMGMNDSGTLYNSWELIFRDPKHIEQFIEIYDRQQPSTPTKPATKHCAECAPMGGFIKSGSSLIPCPNCKGT